MHFGVLYTTLNGLCIAAKDNLFKHFFLYKFAQELSGFFIWNGFIQIRILNGLLLLKPKNLCEFCSSVCIYNIYKEIIPTS